MKNFFLSSEKHTSPEMIRDESRYPPFYTNWARMTYCKIIGLSLFIVLLTSPLNSILHASENEENFEIHNRYQNFDEIPQCEAHLEFLAGKSVAVPNNCSSIATFQIENYNLPTSEYIIKLYVFAGKDTLLSTVALATNMALSSDAISAFSYAELASRRMAILMAESGDIERAVLYASLLFEVKRELLKTLCRDDAMCDKIAPFQGVSGSFGEELKYIDSKKPTSVLICLLRLDSYLGPIRSILSSPRFRYCLND